jgi:hypothetical protein
LWWFVFIIKLSSIRRDSHYDYAHRQLTFRVNIVGLYLNAIAGIGSLSPLLSVKIVHLVDMSELFKISNLVYVGREIVRSLYSSLQGQTVCGGYSELAGSLFVSVKIDGLGNFLEQLTL